MKAAKLLLVDDHELVRKSLKALLLEIEPSLTITEASNGLDAIIEAGKNNYDLILMDISMPDKNGIEAAKEILEKHPEQKILMLTMHKESAFIKKSMNVDIKGYVLKDAPIEELTLAINTILNGRKFFSAEVSESYIAGKQEAEKIIELITDREKEILELLIEGLTSNEISKKLFISKRTVDNHRNRILEKFNMKNTAELISYVLKSGLLD
jgi:DNA-binding NarL/FixJ family response regulator